MSNTLSIQHGEKRRKKSPYCYLSPVGDGAASRRKAKETRRSEGRIDPPDGAGELQLHLLQVEHHRVKEPLEALHPLRSVRRRPSLSLRNRPRGRAPAAQRAGRGERRPDAAPERVGGFELERGALAPGKYARRGRQELEGKWRAGRPVEMFGERVEAAGRKCLGACLSRRLAVCAGGERFSGGEGGICLPILGFRFESPRAREREWGCVGGWRPQAGGSLDLRRGRAGLGWAAP